MKVSGKVYQRMKKMGAGSVFSRADFLDLGTTDNVGVIFRRMQNAGTIRRVACGLYELPQIHPTLGTLSPRPEAIVAATGRRSGSRHQPSGAQAANLLQLTEQVPARVVYYTDGATRTIAIGKRTLELRHRSPRQMAAAGRMSGLVFTALREIGKCHVTPERVSTLRTLLSRRDRRALIEDLHLAPAWMHPPLRRIASDEAS